MLKLPDRDHFWAMQVRTVYDRDTPLSSLHLNTSVTESS